MTVKYSSKLLVNADVVWNGDLPGKEGRDCSRINGCYQEMSRVIGQRKKMYLLKYPFPVGKFVTRIQETRDCFV